MGNVVGVNVFDSFTEYKDKFIDAKTSRWFLPRKLLNCSFDLINIQMWIMTYVAFISWTIPPKEIQRRCHNFIIMFHDWLHFHCQFVRNEMFAHNWQLYDKVKKWSCSYVVTTLQSLNLKMAIQHLFNIASILLQLIILYSWKSYLYGDFRRSLCKHC